MDLKDYYEILGLERNATQDEIKKAYRKLAHTYNPTSTRNPAPKREPKRLARLTRSWATPRSAPPTINGDSNESMMIMTPMHPTKRLTIIATSTPEMLAALLALSAGTLTYIGASHL